MFQDTIELAAFDELHAEVARPVTLADFVNRHDLRMFQTRCCFRFLTKPSQVRGAGKVTEPNYFQRDRAIQTFLPRSIYDALSAAANFFDQMVITELPQNRSNV